MEVLLALQVKHASHCDTPPTVKDRNIFLVINKPRQVWVSRKAIISMLNFLKASHVGKILTEIGLIDTDRHKQVQAAW